MKKCPKCGKIFAPKLVRAGESWDNPPMIEDILENEAYINRFGMCRECYEKTQKTSH